MNLPVCIPHSFLIVVDDVGWWCGNDHRYKNGPSRSGIERRHCIDDYKAVIELGKSLNMRIKCGFVVGEWDRKNILANLRNSNKYGADWDNASRLDPQIDDVCDFINANSKYMELAMHGVMHMYWDDNQKMQHAEFYQTDEKTGRNKMTPPDVIREHIEAYFEILQQNSLTTDIKSFIPPCFRYIYSRSDDQLSAILAEYGIKYVSTPFSSMQYTGYEKPVSACVENGIITVDRTSDLTSWYAVDAKPPDIVKKSYYGMHWPNLLNENPEKNTETVNRWINYFKKYKNNFEILTAKDNAEGSTQALYKRFTDINLNEDTLTLDFKRVDLQGATRLGDFFYLNAKNDLTLSADNSICISISKIHKEYATYKVVRNNPYSSPSIIKLTKKVGI